MIREAPETAAPCLKVSCRGRGTRATIRTETSSIVLTNAFGGAVGRERRAVGRLVLALEPARDTAGQVDDDVEVVAPEAPVEALERAADRLGEPDHDVAAPAAALGDDALDPRLRVAAREQVLGHR